MKVYKDTFFKPVHNDNDKFPFAVRLYVAFMGGGKTLSMVADTYEILKEFKDVYVISNVKLNFIENYMYYESVEDLLYYLQLVSDKKHVLVLMDEGLSYFAENGGINPSLLPSLTHSRKNRVLFMISVQFYNRLNNRMRDFADESVHCSHIGNYQINRVRDEHKTVYDKSTFQFIGPRKDTIIFKRNDILYNSYDTLQKIDITKKTDYLFTAESPPVPVVIQSKVLDNIKRRRFL